MKYVMLLLISCSMPFFAQAQWNYPSYDALKKQFNTLSSHSSVEMASIGKSYGGEEIPMLKIQKDKLSRPTLLIVAGVDGRHPAGVLQSLRIVQEIVGKPQGELESLLSEKSIWVIPVLNPDAYKRNINSGRWHAGNGRAIDNDRDGRLDEDPDVDLNKDGVISQMRVKSPAGQYKVHPLHPSVLVQADRSKGESGQYELFMEGMDTDHDGQYGEDPSAGVNIDRNFTFDYPFFESETGDYAASEPETRAFMDLLFDQPQVAAVLHLGMQNNLSVAEPFDQRKASERIVKSWSKNDVQVAAMVSKLYNDAVKSQGEAPKLPAGKGNLSTTAYYHAGKFSFVTPGWWIPANSDTSKNVQRVPNGKELDRLVNWVNNKGVQGAVLPWTKIDHPDFPGQEVEVGGVVSAFLNNPPIDHLEGPAKLHTEFVLQLAKSLATLEFSTPKVTALGDDIHRIEIRLYNTGAMPTYPEIADRIKHVSKMKAILDMQKNQSFLSGKRLQLYPALQPGDALSLSWLVKGKGTVKLTVGCPTAGEKTVDIKL
ncbi:M14 family zinc carboxypeptidase [Sphingobacterium lactis]|uniref:Zinc carboxypeptidase n=1 Tax=Sphingobacterium lactis TaxID=797291 RepID=A0A1H6AJ93_9SPHI|nr:M14 family zinc carboxypeptidase [Sphingobacterium lactis]SEG48778.1 Zinc carboxypeptidase [Sphingobacterium lactis]